VTDLGFVKGQSAVTRERIAAVVTELGKKLSASF